MPKLVESLLFESMKAKSILSRNGMYEQRCQVIHRALPQKLFSVLSTCDTACRVAWLTQVCVCTCPLSGFSSIVLPYFLLLFSCDLIGSQRLAKPSGVALVNLTIFWVRGEDLALTPKEMLRVPRPFLWRAGPSRALVFLPGFTELACPAMWSEQCHFPFCSHGTSHGACLLK